MLRTFQSGDDVNRPARRWARQVVLAASLLAACSPTRGCVESSFDLAAESHLPRWFASAGVPRKQATVTLDYWIGPIGRTATFTLRDHRGRQVARIVGRVQGDEPLSLVPHSDTGANPYPIYEVITANGIAEVIEHRRMEPTFYISDDPDVKRQLGVH